MKHIITLDFAVNFKPVEGVNITEDKVYFAARGLQQNLSAIHLNAHLDKGKEFFAEARWIELDIKDVTLDQGQCLASFQMQGEFDFCGRPHPAAPFISLGGIKQDLVEAITSFSNGYIEGVRDSNPEFLFSSATIGASRPSIEFKIGSTYPNDDISIERFTAISSVVKSMPYIQRWYELQTSKCVNEATQLANEQAVTLFCSLKNAFENSDKGFTKLGIFPNDRVEIIPWEALNRNIEAAHQAILSYRDCVMNPQMDAATTGDFLRITKSLNNSVSEWMAYDNQDRAIARIVENTDVDLAAFGHDLPLEVHAIGSPCDGTVIRAKDLVVAKTQIKTFLAIRDDQPIFSSDDARTASAEGWCLSLSGTNARILKTGSRTPFEENQDAHLHVWNNAQAGDLLATKALTTLIVMDSEYYQTIHAEHGDPLAPSATNSNSLSIR